MAGRQTQIPAGTGELNVERALLRACREHCRRVRPELLLAGQMLPRPRRLALFCVAAVIDQLREILGDPMSQPPGGAAASQVELSVGGSAPSCQASDESCDGGGCESKSSDGDGSGDCGSCGNGETLAQRQRVCHAVVDYLYNGEETGKDELDGFKAVAQAAGLPRAWFDALIDGAGDGVDVARYATWQRFRTHCAAGAADEQRLLVQAGLWHWDRPLGETAWHQVEAWGVATGLIDHLIHLGAELKRGRLLVPLDDLIKCKLSEADVKGFAQAGGAGEPADDRWLKLIELQGQRIDSLLQGVGALAKTLPPASRRAAMVMNRHLWERWHRFAAAGGNSFAAWAQPQPTYWQRVGGVFRAVGGVGSRNQAAR